MQFLDVSGISDGIYDPTVSPTGNNCFRRNVKGMYLDRYFGHVYDRFTSSDIGNTAALIFCPLGRDP